MCHGNRNLDDGPNTYDDDQPQSTKPTQMFQRTEPAAQKNLQVSGISNNSRLLTRGSNFLQPSSTGHIEVLTSSSANLPTFRSSFSCQRSRNFSNHKFRVKGWKRFDVEPIKVPSSNSSRFCWKLEIKDLDGTRTIFDQLKVLH